MKMMKTLTVLLASATSPHLRCGLTPSRSLCV